MYTYIFRFWNLNLLVGKVSCRRRKQCCLTGSRILQRWLNVSGAGPVAVLHLQPVISNVILITFYHVRKLCDTCFN